MTFSYEALINLFNAKKYDEALHVAKQILERQPDNHNVLQIFAAIHSAEGRHNVSIRIFQNLVRKDKPGGPNYHNLGTELNKVELYEEAIINFKRALVLQVDLWSSYINLGLALGGLGHYKKAIVNYKRAISSGAPRSITDTNLGLALYNMKNYETAARYFQQQKDEKSQSYLLSCLYYLNDKRKFNEHLRAVIDLGYSNALLGAFCKKAEELFSQNINNPFCGDPLALISCQDLRKKYDFTNEFSGRVADLLNRGLIPYRNQSLLKNGKQTAGNIFSLDDSRIKELEKIILYEVDAYRKEFGNRQDGITRNWPRNYSLFGWIVRFFDGGRAGPAYSRERLG